jgi:hypothetical protein
MTLGDQTLQVIISGAVRMHLRHRRRGNRGGLQCDKDFRCFAGQYLMLGAMRLLFFVPRRGYGFSIVAAF